MDSILNGYLSPVTRIGGTAPNFNFRGVFRNNSISNGFDTTDTNLNLIVANDGRCYQLPVTITSSPNPIVRNATIEGVARDLSGTLSTIPTGVAAFVDLTDSLLLMPEVYKISEDLRVCMANYNILVLDSLKQGSDIDSTFIRNDSVFIASNNSEFFSGINSAGSNLFDSDRPILRTPTTGTNIGGSTFTDWFEWWYFTPPTLSLVQSPSTSVYEVGTSTAITLTSTTTNNGGATLSNGEIRVGASQVSGFFSNTVGTFNYTYTPQQSNIGNYNQFSYTFTSRQNWVFGSESGTAVSNSRTVQAVYPVFYGMVTDTATVFADPYSTLTKLVQTEGNKTVSYTGNGLIIYGFPQTWADTNLSSIIDSNGFNVTASFTRVDYPTVTSTGLANNYTDVPYVFYFLNTGITSTSNSNYTFNR